MKVVAGLETPDRGRVLFDGMDVTAMAPQDRGVGMVFQDYALYPSMRGKGNLAYYFQVHQRSEAEAEQRTRKVAEIMGVGFDLLMGRVPTTLSGGEQQRVAIGRCIVRDPSLFLMDEPICNLDAKLRESTRLELKKLLRNFAITSLYVTHDQQEAVFMGDRIAVMRDGRIEQLGTFDELYYTPANLYVAQFIGAPPIGVMPATIEDRRVSIGGGELVAAGRSRRRAASRSGADRRAARGVASGRSRTALCCPSGISSASRPSGRRSSSPPWRERTSSSPLRSTIRSGNRSGSARIGNASTSSPPIPRRRCELPACSSCSRF